jgi:hypothetical protein
MKQMRSNTFSQIAKSFHLENFDTQGNHIKITRQFLDNFQLNEKVKVMVE